MAKNSPLPYRNLDSTKMETYTNNDGDFNMALPPSNGMDGDFGDCYDWTYIAGSLYVPNNIEYNQPEIVPVIISTTELTKFEYNEYVVKQNFKTKENLTPPEIVRVRENILETYPDLNPDCLDNVLPLYEPTLKPTSPKENSENKSDQMINITGKVTSTTFDSQGDQITEGIYNVLVYTSNTYGDKPTEKTIRVKTDTEGNFSMTIPQNTKFISARIKSEAVNATPDSYLMTTVEFNPNQTYYLLQLTLQQTDPVRIGISTTLPTLPATPIPMEQGGLILTPTGSMVPRPMGTLGPSPISNTQNDINPNIPTQRMDTLGPTLITRDNGKLTLLPKTKPSVVTSDGSLPPKPPSIIITSQGYESQEIIPYKGDGTPKSNIGTIDLEPINQTLQKDTIASSNLSDQNIKSLTKSKLSANFFIQKRLVKAILNLKDRLIPILLTLLAKFGITQAQNLIGLPKDKIREHIANVSICPDIGVLHKIIRKKNRVVTGINNALKIIDSTTIFLGITGGVLTGLEIGLNAIAILPLPIPPAVPIVWTQLERLIKKLKATNVGLLAILVLLRQTLVLIVDFLNLLDMLIQNCAPDNEEFQEELNQEILDLIEEQKTRNNSPIIKIVNGFTMDLETETTENPLKRKRAIAKDTSGTVVLKGEWSFSSIDQILIDELVFYIQTNNLKAD
tara:strand:+ start:1292 stop:3325 length:2034 start_codon:yes stop_codon:yes gene_type:complete